MLEDNIKSVSQLKKNSPQDSVKRYQIIFYHYSFESRIRELSGNKLFQLGSLSPDI